MLRRGLGEEVDHLCFHCWVSSQDNKEFCIMKSPVLRLAITTGSSLLYATSEQMVKLLSAQSFDQELFETFEAILGDMPQTDEEAVDILLMCCE